MNEETDAFGNDGHPAVATAGRSRRIVQRSLWALTAVFGLAAWVIGLVALEDPGFAVTLSVLAGTVAAVGLVPGQSMRGWLIVAVAVTAFTAATTTAVVVGGASWGPVVVDVLVALQAVVAVSALLLEPRVQAATQPTSEGDYAAYAEYVQAYREYARQYESHWPEEYSVAGFAEASGEARGTVAGTASDDGDAWADLQAKYARHMAPTAGATAEPDPRRPDGDDTADAGMPGVDWMKQPHQASGQVSPGSTSTSPGAY